MAVQAACRGGSFAVESVAAFAWNGWQASSGISGNLGLEYAIRFPKQILVAYSPATCERWAIVVELIDNMLKAIA